MTVGDAEVMLDESLLFAQKLKDHGANVQLSVVPQMWHVFVGYQNGGGKGKLVAAVDAMCDFGVFVRHHALT